MFFYTVLPKLLNMSLTASIAIICVLPLRLALKKAPKAISRALWGVVLFRLLCPVSIGSSLSLFGLLEAPAAEVGALTSAIEYVPGDIAHREHPAVTLPVPGVGETINRNLPQGEEQLAADPLEAPVAIATYVWMSGVLAMAAYSAAAYIRLRNRLLTASPLRDNIYLADGIPSPFVMGLLHPKIYLPSGLEERERDYILLHERHHIRRGDHIIKALAFLALSVHWFNPLVWLAFVLSSQDMEMSCDEAVVKQLGAGVRADYSASLLTLAAGRRMIAGTPLAFGEGDAKGRIRNLANWRKPALWVVLASVAACAVLAVCLLTNPQSYQEAVQVNGRLYTRQGETASALPAGSKELGALQGITHRTKEMPAADFHAVNLDAKYAGNRIYQSGTSGTTIYLEDLNGFYIPFVSAQNEVEKKDDSEAPEPAPAAGNAAAIAYSDLNHDQVNEEILVREVHPGMLYELAVEENGVELWSTEAGPAHVAWNTIMLYNEDGQDYLARYQPTMFQGVGSYTCTVFSLEGGQETVKRSWSVDFTLPGDARPVEETPEMARFAGEVGVLLRSCTVLLSTEQGIVVARPTDATGLPQLYPVRFDPDEIQAAIDGAASAQELTENAAQFPAAPLKLLFASGAGAWGTTLTLNPDGSFTGSYSDADMGSSTTEYPNGTCYISDFEGSFTDIQQLSDYAWSMKLSDLTTEKEAGDVWIEDGTRYEATGACGVAGGEEFRLYAPGTSADELPADCRSWWPDIPLWRSGEMDVLDGWALCNISTGQGFFTSRRS